MGGGRICHPGPPSCGDARGATKTRKSEEKWNIIKLTLLIIRIVKNQNFNTFLYEANVVSMMSESNIYFYFARQMHF